MTGKSKKLSAKKIQEIKKVNCINSIVLLLSEYDGFSIDELTDTIQCELNTYLVDDLKVLIGEYLDSLIEDSELIGRLCKLYEI